MKLTLHLQLRMTKQAIATVLARPFYLMICVVSGILMLGILVWSMNYTLVWYVVSNSTLSIAAKLTFIYDGYKNLFTNFSFTTSVGMVLFALAFGINLSCVSYISITKSASRIPLKSNSGAVLMAAVSSSCVACGTSFITPIIAALGGTASPFIEKLSALTVWLGLCLLLYSIMRMSSIILSQSQSSSRTKKLA